MHDFGVRPPGAPAARPIRSWQDAEENAVEWTRYLGFRDALRTPPGADGGLDIIGTGVAGQVKANMHGKIAQDRTQALVGAAGGRRGQCLFYSLSLFSKPAVDFADTAGVALFTFEHDGNVVAANTLATGLLRASAQRNCGQLQTQDASGWASPQRSAAPPPERAPIYTAAQNFARMAVLLLMACVAAGVGYAGIATHPHNMAGAIAWCVVSTLAAIASLWGCIRTGRVLWQTLKEALPSRRSRRSRRVGES